jgi:hypothetical protein
MVIDGRTLETASHGDCGGENSDSDLERRRKNNRENMRRRRADPMRSAQEQEKRKNRKRSTAANSGSVAMSVPQPMGRVCAICHLRAAVEEITRLEPSESSRGGYVQVRLPYCGRC